MSRPLKLILVSYEFTFSPFSGNGILARSIAKALLQLGCHLHVLCCRPCQELQSHDQHLAAPEISEEASKRLRLIPVELAESHGWRKLDDQSAWEHFCFGNLDQERVDLLQAALLEADAILAVDWTGAYAYRSFPVNNKPLVYMNFRVYSSGVQDEARCRWFDLMEREALANASVLVVLSEQDKLSLSSLSDRRIELLLPPLRGDMQELAQQDTAKFLPTEVAGAISGRKRCLVTCVCRLSSEKKVFRFLRFLEKSVRVLEDLELVPLLAGASAEEAYAESLKAELRRLMPRAIILESFLSPKAMASIFARTALNFHPCAYDAYGMTIVEAAACGAASVLAGPSIGAWALLQSESLSVEMPQDEQMISEEAVSAICSLLRSGKLEDLGKAAQKRALEWDEQAYGQKLLEVIYSVL